MHPSAASGTMEAGRAGRVPPLDHLIAVSPSPGQFTEALAVCLAPLFNVLYEALMEQLAADPYVLRIPGHDAGTARFGDT